MHYYADAKAALAGMTGYGDPMLHLHAGLIILVLTRLVTGRSFRTFIPFAVVLIAALANEVMDRINHGLWQDDTISDIAYTLAWPLIISACARIRQDRVTAGEGVR